jgi:TM2 domain-containing membrane protein YozV
MKNENKRGVIPLWILTMLAITALLGTGVIGFMLGQGVQGFALTVAFTLLGLFLLVNVVNIIKWVKEVRGQGK